MKRFYLLVLFVIAATTGIRSQNSSSANVTSRATIVEPIKIEKSVDLDFGNVIAGQTSGMVVLAPDGTRTAYGVSLSNAVPGQVNAAEALVTHGELTYNITLPQTFELYNEINPNQSLILDQFTVQPQPNGINEGTDIIKIGATLNLMANQVAGYYTNPAGFNVTVTYN